MALDRYSYPFTAIVGQDEMKLALVLNAINPTIGGVLIRGEKGTGKSTAVRALARLLPEQKVVEGCHFGCHPDDPEDWCADCRERSIGGALPVATRRMRVVELPINASEDRVVGTIDLEAALKEGSRRFEPGVLAEANRNILYVDEGNRHDEHIACERDVDGHRSHLSCARAAQAKAACDSGAEVGIDHVGDVAEMVFAHRVHSVPFGKGGPNLGEVISRMVGQA